MVSVSGVGREVFCPVNEMLRRTRNGCLVTRGYPLARQNDAEITAGHRGKSLCLILLKQPRSRLGRWWEDRGSAL